jgi:hypothetical protein
MHYLPARSAVFVISIATSCSKNDDSNVKITPDSCILTDSLIYVVDEADANEQKMGVKFEKRKEIFKYLEELQIQINLRDSITIEKTYRKTAEYFNIGVDTAKIMV